MSELNDCHYRSEISDLRHDMRKGTSEPEYSWTRLSRRETLALPSASFASVGGGIFPKTTSLNEGLHWSFVTSNTGVDPHVFCRGTEIYLYSDALYSIDRETGVMNWKYEPPTPHGGTTLGVADRCVIAETEKHVLGIEQADGTERWRVATPNSPALGKGSVYVVEDTTLVARSTDSGTTEWRFELDKASWKRPVLIGEMVVLGTVGGRTVAVDAETGRAKWDFTVESDEYLMPIPHRGLSSEDSVGPVPIWSSSSGRLYGVGTSDGTEKWTFDHSTDLSWFPGIVTAEAAIVTDGPTVLVLERADGARRWSFTSSKREPVSTPKLVDESVILMHGGTVRSLSKVDGSKKWISTLDAGREARLGEPSSSVFPVYQQDGTVVVLSATDGRVHRKYELRNSLSSPPTATGEVLYVVTEEGKLFAIDGSARPVGEWLSTNTEVVGVSLITVAALGAGALRYGLRSRDGR